MINSETTRPRARYNAWANKLIFGAVAALPAGEATKERRTLSKTVVRTLNRLYVTGLPVFLRSCTP